MTAFLYIVTVLVWGTSWLAITFQNGSVDSLVSIFYRFGLASLLLLPILFLSKTLQATRRVDHAWFALQGACLFCFNFICFYHASKYMPSGLLSIIFSTAIFYNAINNRIFWKIKPTAAIYSAGVLGILGLVLLFWPELRKTTASRELWLGVGLSVMGTLSFSWGNMISIHNKKHGIDPLTGTAYGMFYGTLFLLLIIQLSQTAMTWDSRSIYIYSLIYLAVFASIIGFTAYLSLVNRIGANQAAYTTVVTPIIALALSSVYEGYQWELMNVVGMALVLLGNVVAMNLLPMRNIKFFGKAR